jgi:hypothetical protein
LFRKRATPKKPTSSHAERLETGIASFARCQIIKVNATPKNGEQPHTEKNGVEPPRTPRTLGV